jgi:hypothetical protein
MHNCPQCHNMILIEAHFCDRCGYRLADASTPPALPHTTNTTHTPPKVPMVHVPTPTRTIRPHVTHQPNWQHDQELINQPSQVTQADQQSVPVEGATTFPLTHKESQPPTPQPHGLIRPVGAQHQQGSSPNRELPAHTGIFTQEPPRSEFSSWTTTHQRQAPHAVQAPPAPAPPTLPLEDLSTDNIPIVVVKGKPLLLDTQERLDQMEGDESFVATSIAAEHWRTSWRNRQRTEAGPATTVSRGHSSVPEPLLAMQHSLLRMRAIIIPRKTKQLNGPGFWITIVLMLCLIVGLIAYIISTYLPVAGKPVHVNTHIVAHQPTLTIQGAALATIAQGQILHLHGENLHTGVHL